MDPLADKLLITAALVSLVQMDLAPAWMVAVILGREFAVTVLRSLAHSRGVAIPASPLGKFKMASQVTAILLLILGRDGPPLVLTLGRIALWVAVLTAVASAVDYYRRFNHVLTGRREAGGRDFEPGGKMAATSGCSVSSVVRSALVLLPPTSYLLTSIHSPVNSHQVSDVHRVD